MDLARNKQAIFYKPFTGTEELIDEYGNVTGSFKPTYGNLKSLRLSISANKGDTATQQFGNVLDYDRTMSTSDMGVVKLMKIQSYGLMEQIQANHIIL